MMGRRDERERVPLLLPSFPLSLFLPRPPHLVFISFLASLWLDSADRQTDGLHTTGKPAQNGLEFTASALRRETFFLECVCIDCHVDSAGSRPVTCPLLRPRASLRGWVCVVGGPERDTRLRGSSPQRAGGGLNVELTRSSTYTPPAGAQSSCVSVYPFWKHYQPFYSGLESRILHSPSLFLTLSMKQILAV